MPEGNATSIEQLESMLREGRISNEEYTRLRDAMRAQPRERPKNAGRDRLRKSWSNHELGGVCDGIAQYFDVSSTRIRLLFLLLLLVTGGTAILIYLALYIVLPWDESEQDEVARFPWKFAAAVLVLGLAILWILQIIIPTAIVNVAENVGTELPTPVRILFNLSDWMSGAGMIIVPLGIVALVAVGAMLTRHRHAYVIFVRFVTAVIVIVLTLQVLTLVFFLLTVA